MRSSLTRTSRLPAVLAIIDAGAQACVLAAAEATAEDAKYQIANTAGAGRKYDRLPYPSSSPGQAPANQDETLIKSIVVPESYDLPGGYAAVGAVVTDLDYGFYLEAGTNKMDPRPYLGPAAVVGEEAMVASVRETAEALKALG